MLDFQIDGAGIPGGRQMAVSDKSVNVGPQPSGVLWSKGHFRGLAVIAGF
jgi:hypothetical protein